MLHKMKLRSAPYAAIEAGYKSIELRLYDEKRRLLQVGDDIQFTCEDNPDRSLVKKICALHVFDSFTSLYQKLPLLRCGYTPFTLLSASPDDMNQYYTAEAQARNGVVGIELEEAPLARFIAGQSGALYCCSDYETALKEMKEGRKKTHWMWYVFPQIQGLSRDRVTEYFALSGKEEAAMFYQHPLLGHRLLQITEALLALPTDDPVSVFGMTDALKFRACMTLFHTLFPEEFLFRAALEQYCLGAFDAATLSFLQIY